MITIRIQDRSIPAATYLAGLKLAKANPDRMFKTTLWGWWPGTGSEIVEQYRRDLNSRINERGAIQTPSSRVHPSTWGKTLAQRAKSGDLEVKRRATWGMSDSERYTSVKGVNREHLYV